MEPVIVVEGLTKRYGGVVAVSDVSLTVGGGEIFGIVGPNGAGKTTTVEMLQGLRRPDAGTVEVLGLDPLRQAGEIRQRVGTQLQSAVLPERITVEEALDLYASFYRNPRSPDELIQEWGLGEKRRATFESLSGGQRQRLFIALALVGTPEIVVLDELTTGLDPQARRATWDLVRAIRATGVTIVLVTHFMEEAELLCDRVAVIEAGRIAALGTPAELRRRGGDARLVRFSAPTGFSARWLDGVAEVDAVDVQGRTVTVRGRGALLARVATALAEHGASPEDLEVERATLEDAYLTLTTGDETLRSPR